MKRAPSWNVFGSWRGETPVKGLDEILRALLARRTIVIALESSWTFARRSFHLRDRRRGRVVVGGDGPVAQITVHAVTSRSGIRNSNFRREK